MVMPTLPADSVDAVVTDPPYGLGFMGKEWDAPGKTFVERKPVRTTRFDPSDRPAQPPESV